MKPVQVISRTSIVPGCELATRSWSGTNPRNPNVSVFDPGFPLGSVRELLYGLGSLLLSAFMAMVCVSSYRDPANNVWSFGWGLKRRIP
jgi:hypothetical protein